MIKIMISQHTESLTPHTVFSALGVILLFTCSGPSGDGGPFFAFLPLSSLGDQSTDARKGKPTMRIFIGSARQLSVVAR